MVAFEVRRMTREDRTEVAELIYLSTNAWYQANRHCTIFSGGPSVTEVYFDVYEALDPGCGVVAVHGPSGRLIGSCFYHPRQTHVSLGIMNSHPSYARSGVARSLLGHIADFAERQGKPLRLVSSAMNLDSFSLYTRAGLVPRCVYQDMILDVPEGGLAPGLPGFQRIREGRPEDAAPMADLEMRLAGIRREKDYRYFIENRDGFWHVSVYEGADGQLEGFCASSAHPGCNMVGPCVAVGADQAAAMLRAELDRHRGRRPVCLVPVECTPLVQALYAWGARNCELHLGQVRGAWTPVRGVMMPTFLPETA
jgi:GNAT superfamily N-acetyltransferase